MEVPKAEARIISLSPSITRVLLHLGAREQLVGVDRYSQEVSGLDDVPSLGALFNPDIERTIELNPTVVVAVHSAAQRDFFRILRERGVRVEEIEAYSLDEVLTSFETLGSLVGHESEAEALIESVQLELEELAESVESVPIVRVAIVLEREPLYVVGGANFINALIEASGGENVFADLDSPYPQVSLETLADRAPDVVLDTVFDPSSSEAPEEQIRGFWKRYSWVKRVEPLRHGAATLPGPDLADGARQLMEKLHPELGQPIER